MSASLHEKASPGCVFFLDDIWDLLSIPGNALSNDLNQNSMALGMGSQTMNLSQQDIRRPIERIIYSPEVTDSVANRSSASAGLCDHSGHNSGEG